MLVSSSNTGINARFFVVSELLNSQGESGIFQLSVIIPVYNDQKGLDACLQALKFQHNLHSHQIEIIVVDNSSEPPMVIPPEMKDRVKLIICSKKGSYAARNLGAASARGKRLAFLDADCIPTPDWALNGLKALEDSQQPCCLGGEVLFLPIEKPTPVEAYQLLMGFGQRSNIMDGQFSATANMFVCSDLFRMVGPFNEDLLSGGDREWAWRARKEGVRLIFGDSVIVYTRARRTLRAAMVQARRVAGGRSYLQRIYSSGSASFGGEVKQRGGLLSKVKFIMGADKFNFGERLKILFCAVLIRICHDLELLRVTIGGSPERR